MKIENLAFPVTLEAFVAYQEAGVGRRLESMERKVLEAQVPLFNRAYMDGLQADSAALASDIAKVGEMITSHGDDAVLMRILKSCRWWISYAWEQGAGKAAAV